MRLSSTFLCIERVLRVAAGDACFHLPPLHKRVKMKGLRRPSLHSCGPGKYYDFTVVRIPSVAIACKNDALFDLQ